MSEDNGLIAIDSRYCKCGHLNFLLPYNDEFKVCELCGILMSDGKVN
jgi:hypothetical protein